MPKRSILIVNSTPDTIGVLVSTFRDSGYHVDTALNDAKAIEKVKENNYDVLLTELASVGIDGCHILREVERETLCQTKLVFMSQKSDIFNRLKCLKLGAADYIVKPIHVRELVARVEMVIRRTKKKISEFKQAPERMSGRLEDLNVNDLIELFSIERKSGTVTITNDNGHSGQLLFKDGKLYNAATALLQGEEAVYKMINWGKGRFSSMFCNIEPEKKINLSNLGILLQGAKRMQLRDQLLQQIPSTEAVVITTTNFKQIMAQNKMDPRLKKFINLFDGERTLRRIIDDSEENEIITLRRIVKLYNLGFLYVLRDYSEQTQIVNQESEQSTDSIESNGHSEKKESLFSENDHFDFSDVEFPSGMGESMVISSNEADEKEADEENDDQQENLPVGDVEEFEHPELLHNDGEHNFVHPFDQLRYYDHEFASTDDITDDGHKQEQQVNLTEETEFQLAQHSVIVLSTHDDERRDFMQALDARKQSIEELEAFFTSDVDIAVVDRESESFNVISFTIDQEFTSLLEYFNSTVVGCVLIIKSGVGSWAYFTYLQKALQSKLSVPITLLIKGHQSELTYEIAEIKSRLKNQNNLTIRCEPVFQQNTVIQILLSVTEQKQRVNTKHSNTNAQ